jgi:hypothetical protein
MSHNYTFSDWALITNPSSRVTVKVNLTLHGGSEEQGIQLLERVSRLMTQTLARDNGELLQVVRDNALKSVIVALIPDSQADAVVTITTGDDGEYGYDERFSTTCDQVVRDAIAGRDATDRIMQVAISVMPLSLPDILFGTDSTHIPGHYNTGWPFDDPFAFGSTNGSSNSRLTPDELLKLMAQEGVSIDELAAFLDYLNRP